MNAQFKATNPDNIPFTITCTMTLREWTEVKGAIGKLSTNGSNDLYTSISHMISQAERTYYPEVVEK